jgi:hypothetical protein
MSTVLEPKNSALMGREQYRQRINSSQSIALYSNIQDRNQWENCFTKLRKIRSYQFDWNDEGAEPLNSEVVALATTVARLMKGNYEPAPSGCIATDEGHVIFVWEDETGYTEVEIDRHLSCTIRRIRPGAKRAESAEFTPFSRLY